MMSSVISEMNKEQSRSSTPDKIPEASDTFRRVLEQLNISDESPLNTRGLDFLDGVAQRRHSRVDSTSDEDETLSSPLSSTTPPVRRASLCYGQLPSTKLGKPRIPRQRRKSVQWVDEHFIVPVAHEPTAEEKHVARIFIKTLPKSILKNSHENIVVTSE